MNAIALLKTDHEKVEDLFDRFDATQEPRERTEIIQELERELRVHFHIEETVFYPFFQKLEGFEDQIDEAYEEHQEAKSILQEITTRRDADELDDLVGELNEAVDHHVQEEENQLFPKIESELSPEQLEDLGKRLEEAKRAREASEAA